VCIELGSSVPFGQIDHDRLACFPFGTLQFFLSLPLAALSRIAATMPVRY
jgi:hypothetical protein